MELDRVIGRSTWADSYKDHSTSKQITNFQKNGGKYYIPAQQRATYNPNSQLARRKLESKLMDKKFDEASILAKSDSFSTAVKKCS